MSENISALSLYSVGDSTRNPIPHRHPRNLLQLIRQHPWAVFCQHSSNQLSSRDVQHSNALVCASISLLDLVSLKGQVFWIREAYLSVSDESAQHRHRFLECTDSDECAPLQIQFLFLRYALHRQMQASADIFASEIKRVDSCLPSLCMPARRDSNMLDCTRYISLLAIRFQSHLFEASPTVYLPSPVTEPFHMEFAQKSLKSESHRIHRSWLAIWNMLVNQNTVPGFILSLGILINVCPIRHISQR